MAEGKTQTPLINHLRTSTITDPHAGQYIQEGWEAKKSGKGKICWVTEAVPAALLHSFDLHLFFPEIDAIGVGVMGDVVKWQMIAENAGYSRDLCSYARANIGRVFGGAGLAEGAYPAPDFLVTARMNCTTYVHWWEMLARNLKIPLFVFDGPLWDKPRSEPIPKHYEEYWVKRSYELVAFLEEQTGQKFDEDRYRENMRNELDAHKIFEEITMYSQRVPSPLSNFDLLSAMLAVAWWRGKKIAVDILKEVKAELDERVANGISALANEKHRVALVSNPPWYKVQMLPDWLAEANAVIVSSLLTGMVVDHTDVSGGSFKEVMSALVKHVLNYNIAEKIKVAEKQVVDWKCDCMALMDNRGCKIIAFPVPEIMAELEKKLNLPCFRFQGNMCDPRDFNEQEVRSQFETFIELLEQR